ncbi:MAG: SDR family oxidoreductase [Halieaceae bacterium]|nr:SDR family oxidoreductase [Halieaceae bacterium]
MDSKTVLITGGSRGIGRAIAVSLAAQGHRVAVTGRDNEKLAEVVQELPGGIAIDADVADASHTSAVIDEVEKDLGPVDVLINNAGIGGGDAGPQSFMDMSVDDWWRVQETNVKGPVLYSHAVLPGMVERGSGVIINMGSYIAIRPMPGATAYAASKAALARFTDCLSADLEGSGVQVFCVSPGLVLTDMTRDLPFIADIPDSEFQQPEDIAGHVTRLISGRFAPLSGLFLHVKDDLEALLEHADSLREQRLYSLRIDGIKGLIP